MAIWDSMFGGGALYNPPHTLDRNCAIHAWAPVADRRHHRCLPGAHVKELNRDRWGLYERSPKLLV